MCSIRCLHLKFSRCSRIFLPLSTHMYPTDPQCSRTGKWSPNCFSEHVKAAAALAKAAGKPFYMTEVLSFAQSVEFLSPMIHCVH